MKAGKLLGLTMLIFFGVSFFSIPSSISMAEDENERLNFYPFMKAELSKESVDALSIKNADSKSVFTRDIELAPKKSGKASMAVSLFGVAPIKTIEIDILPTAKLIPVGKSIGVTLDTEGIMVLGAGGVETSQGLVEPAKGALKSGDLILKANGKDLEKKSDLIDAVEDSNGENINLTVKRNGNEMEVSIKPAFSIENGEPKIGVWVRDSAQGIGTITYYNPQDGSFGALGHGVYDVDTKNLMAIKKGKVCRAELSGIQKGEKGKPGEILGGIDKMNVLGDISYNNEKGLYGKLNEDGIEFFGGKEYAIADKSAVKEGGATILSDADGETKEYAIEILSIDKNNKDTSKDMVIKITDEKLLGLTGGIVQGMSGSPIMQNGKIVGAVTHVFVNDPTKGYGIFIENMIS